MRDLPVSIIRTVVPTLVGLIVSALLQAGIELDPGTLTVVLDGLLVGGYYAVVRWAEARWSWVGWLLGAPVQPRYGDRELTVTPDVGDLREKYGDALAAATATALEDDDDGYDRLDGWAG